jgi:hypothetical protein
MYRIIAELCENNIKNSILKKNKLLVVYIFLRIHNKGLKKGFVRIESDGEERETGKVYLPFLFPKCRETSSRELFSEIIRHDYMKTILLPSVYLQLPYCFVLARPPAIFLIFFSLFWCFCVPMCYSSASCSNGSFLEYSPPTEDAQVRFQAWTCQSWDLYFRMKMTFVKSLHTGEPNMICLAW